MVSASPGLIPEFLALPRIPARAQLFALIRTEKRLVAEFVLSSIGRSALALSSILLIREFLAETTEAKLKRICGNDAYFRYIPRHYEAYLRVLQERYTAPFRIATRSDAPQEDRSNSQSTIPTVIAASESLFGRPTEAGRVCTTVSSPTQPPSTYEADTIEREG